jgi:hypothetical protein
MNDGWIIDYGWMNDGFRNGESIMDGWIID